MDATPIEPTSLPFAPDADLSTLEQLEAELTQLQEALARVDDGIAEAPAGETAS
jgi:hypothetical protein